MDLNEARAALIEALEITLEFAEKIGESTTAHLIEQAVDDARSKQIASRVLRFSDRH